MPVERRREARRRYVWGWSREYMGRLDCELLQQSDVRLGYGNRRKVIPVLLHLIHSFSAVINHGALKIWVCPGNDSRVGELQAINLFVMITRRPRLIRQRSVHEFSHALVVKKLMLLTGAIPYVPVAFVKLAIKIDGMESLPMITAPVRT